MQLFARTERSCDEKFLLAARLMPHKAAHAQMSLPFIANPYATATFYDAFATCAVLQPGAMRRTLQVELRRRAAEQFQLREGAKSLLELVPE
jgi:hypothetical protein